MTYQPIYLERWNAPTNYFGDDWSDWYVVARRNRDSDRLTRSNFESCLTLLGGERKTVQIATATHWACGWVQHLLIHYRDRKRLEIADSIEQRLAHYPVVDERHWNEMEEREISDEWKRMSISERVHWCRMCGDSIFAARRSYAPDRVYDRLREE